MTAQEIGLLRLIIKDDLGKKGYHVEKGLIASDAIKIAYLLGINDVELYLTNDYKILFIGKKAPVEVLNKMGAIKRIDPNAKAQEVFQVIIPDDYTDGR